MGPEENPTISTTSGSRSPGNMSREVTFPCKAISLAVADLSQGIPAATIVGETQYLRSQNLILLSKCALIMPPLRSRQRRVKVYIITLGAHAQRRYCYSLNLTSRVSVRPRNDTIYPTGDEGQKICGVFSENDPLQS